MRLGAFYDHNPAHFRFARSLGDTPMIEAHEPSSKLRWAFAVAVVSLSILAMAI